MSRKAPLTERQVEVLYLTMVGLSVQEIADTLDIPHRTAKYHSDNLRARYRVNRRRKLIAIADRTFDTNDRAAIRTRIESMKEAR